MYFENENKDKSHVPTHLCMLNLTVEYLTRTIKIFIFSEICFKNIIVDLCEYFYVISTLFKRNAKNSLKKL